MLRGDNSDRSSAWLIEKIYRPQDSQDKLKFGTLTPVTRKEVFPTSEHALSEHNRS